MFCYNWKIERTWCTSPGGGRNVYEVNEQLVRPTLHLGGEYVSATEFCAAFNMPAISENTYYRIGKAIERKGIEKYKQIYGEGS